MNLPAPGSTDASAAVKQAVAETTLIQEANAKFATHGVNTDAFKSQQRSDTSIPVQNIKNATIEELRTHFEEHSPVLRVVMRPSAIVQLPNQHAVGQRSLGRLTQGQCSSSFRRSACRDVEAPYRVLHILLAATKWEHTLDKLAISKLSLMKQQLLKKKVEAEAAPTR
ncbi:hypothetical protein QBC43DRAFT_328934 [Cladorrhinum sp. PSN259]|nr:hypothetical protein QBC43DRAFT_328934 [Cladorrhinum sp. PSN259]